MAVYTHAQSHISAAHYPRNGGPLHGHTWRIRATWLYTGQCVEQLKGDLEYACRKFDHTLLPDELAREEDLAQHIGGLLGAIRVDIWREAEGFGATWESDLLRK